MQRKIAKDQSNYFSLAEQQFEWNVSQKEMVIVDAMNTSWLINNSENGCELMHAQLMGCTSALLTLHASMDMRYNNGSLGWRFIFIFIALFVNKTTQKMVDSGD